jgi:FKBP-type peptidyl-prolyl cis-trans isomerase (trigger factor)
MKSEVKKSEKSTVDIIAEMPAEKFMSYRDSILEKLGENVEIKGFRKGAAPAEMVEKHIGEIKVLDEMAHHAIAVAYPELLKEHDIDAIGRPSVSVTKLAKDNDLGFTITTAVMPEIKLPDYKKIASKEMKQDDDIEVSDAELDEAIMNIRKMRMQDQAVKDGKDAKEIAKTEEKDIPELDDEYVKSLGKFENVEDFKNKLRENLKTEKKQKEKEKKHLAIADALIEKTDVDVPQLLTNYELQKMVSQLEHDIAMTGMKFDDYLKNIKKTKDELMKEWQEPAEKRATMNLVIDAISKAEKLEPTEDEIKAEVAKIMEQYKDMKGVDEVNVQAYVASILTNQKVFDFFEAQK